MPNSSYNFGYMRDWGVGGNNSAMQNTLFNDGVTRSLGNNNFTPSFMQKLTGYTDPNTGMGVGGFGNLALGTGQALLGGYLGMKQYGLAKKQLGESKRQFDKNFKMQKDLTNTRMEDRQRARVASNPGHWDSVEDYMKKNRVGDKK